MKNYHYTNALIFIIICCAIISTKADYPSRNDVVSQINKARTRPSSFASIIQNSYSTYSSRSEIQAAVSFLRNVTPLTALKNETGLDATAQMQANYLNSRVANWANPHIGCSNSRISDRIKLAGSWSSKIGESIAYSINSAEELVAVWIIDSQVSTRQNRMNIFEPGFTEVGVGISGSSANLTMVANFAQDFTCNATCVNVPKIGGKYDCTGDPFAGAHLLYNNLVFVLLALLGLTL